MVCKSLIPRVMLSPNWGKYGEWRTYWDCCPRKKRPSSPPRIGSMCQEIFIFQNDERCRTKVAGLIHFFRPRAPSIVEYRHDWWAVAEYLTPRCAAVVLAGCGCPIGNRRVGGCKPFLGCPFLLSMIKKQPVISCHIMSYHVMSSAMFFCWLKRY